MSQTPYSFALQGGLDLTSRPKEIRPGRIIASANYEPSSKGYRRVDGYERFDGRSAPHRASYAVQRFEAGDTPAGPGDIVSGATSGATGEVLSVAVESGDYITSDAAGYLALTQISGEFEDGEALQVLGVDIAAADGPALVEAANSEDLHNAYLQAAAEAARSKIGPVPGSGPLRGVWRYADKVYAFRDNADATAGGMFVETPNGWTAVDLGRELFFSAGAAEIAEGETLTGATSGATATVRRVVLQEGDWSTTDAAGYLCLSDVTGVFQDGETITTAAPGSATASGADIAVALLPGGRYRFINHNFFGSSRTRRMYGVDGVNHGFSFDGETFARIRTGMADDRPERLAALHKHLFFTFALGSLQHSAPGEPLIWNVVQGASEIGLGADITDLLTIRGIALVYGLNSTAILRGTSSDDFTLETMEDGAGAKPHTVQNVAQPLHIDEHGIGSFTASQRFGDFNLGRISEDVEPLFRARRGAGASPIASMAAKSKAQYRLFWDDGVALYTDFTANRPQSMMVRLPVKLTCCAAAETEDDDRLFFGDENGFVYEMDVGPSFDGQPVEAFLRLPFSDQGMPGVNKRYFKAIAECDAAPTTELRIVGEFSYARPDQPASPEETLEVRGGGGFWGESDWGDFYWSSQVEGEATAGLRGGGHNVSICISSAATYEKPHTLQGMTIYYSRRGLRRR